MLYGKCLPHATNRRLNISSKLIYMYIFQEKNYIDTHSKNFKLDLPRGVSYIKEKKG